MELFWRAGSVSSTPHSSENGSGTVLHEFPLMGDKHFNDPAVPTCCREESGKRPDKSLVVIAAGRPSEHPV